jgi:hypothetical protein
MSELWAKLLSILGTALVRYGVLLLVRASRRRMEDAGTKAKLTRQWKAYVARNIKEQLERQQKPP